MELTRALSEAVSAVCPIVGVGVGRRDDRATWRIDFKDEATPDQRAAAQAVLDAFDINEPAAEVISESNALVSAKRSRATQIEEIERQMSLGAPQGDINRAVLDLLKE